MKICSISAKNFRTLEDFNLNLQPNYCAISGRNNAGKSAIVKIIQFFFNNREEDRYYPFYRYGISFQKDSTQWNNIEEMEVSISVQLDRKNDSEIFFVVEAYADKISNDSTIISISQKFFKDESSVLICRVDDKEIEGQNASEILKKFRATSCLVVHNSTSPSRQFYYLGESYTEVLEAYFSAEDRKKISEAEKNLQRKMRKAARQHKDDLEKLLGRLNEKYQVELSTMDRSGSLKFPLEIKLTDKNVEVPLTDWGAGTQNRTRTLLSVLEATRIRSSVTEKDRLTPVFLVEEPESFLHPSAQAEFGRVLNDLAKELQIQIIATTHSPYMLNQHQPSANILLERRVFRGSPRETLIKDTSGAEWMLPFADNLGIIPREFDSWKKIFDAHSNKVVLVEGQIDKEYFNLVRTYYPKIYSIPGEVEIVPYEGKDTLKNTSILQFMISKFGRVFITFDLDAKSEVEPALKRIGLNEGEHFCSIGVNVDGARCIEGLLPDVIKKSVYGNNVDLVTALQSADAKVRKLAKGKLKSALLEEFRISLPQEKELAGFKSLFSIIGKRFHS